EYSDEALALAWVAFWLIQLLAREWVRKKPKELSSRPPMISHSGLVRVTRQPRAKISMPVAMPRVARSAPTRPDRLEEKVPARQVRNSMPRLLAPSCQGSPLRRKVTKVYRLMNTMKLSPPTRSAGSSARLPRWLAKLRSVPLRDRGWALKPRAGGSSRSTTRV